LDFLFQIVENTHRKQVEILLKRSREYDALTKLKLIAHLGDIRHGKPIKTAYLYSLYWLYNNMFSTLRANLKQFVYTGYWKDLLQLLMMAAFNVTYRIIWYIKRILSCVKNELEDINLKIIIAISVIIRLTGTIRRNESILPSETVL
jgi:hypothetical protein